MSERKTQREGEVRYVFQVWCHIMCLWGTVCVPGLPALFIPDSFVLGPGLTLCAALAHQILPTHAQAKAMKLLKYLFVGIATGLYAVLGNSTHLSGGTQS